MKTLRLLSVVLPALALSACLKPAKTAVPPQPQKPVLEDTLTLIELRTSEKALEVDLSRTEVPQPARAPDEAVAKDFSEQIRWTKNEFGDLSYSATDSKIGLDFFQATCADLDCNSVTLVLGRDGTGQDAAQQVPIHLMEAKSFVCTLATSISGTVQKTELTFPVASLARSLASKRPALYARGTQYDDATSQIRETWLRTTLGTSSTLLMHVFTPVTRPIPGQPAKEAAATVARVTRETWDENAKTFDVDATGSAGAKLELRCKY